MEIERKTIRGTSEPDGLRANWRRAKHKRRLRHLEQADGSIGRESYHALYAEAVDCFYCGQALTSKQPHRWRSTDATLDHLEPISRDGIHGLVNVVVACARCNFTKKDTPLEDWLAQLPTDRQSAVRPLVAARGTLRFF